MLKVQAEKLGNVIVLHCQGRIVSGDAIETLRDKVFVQLDADAVVIDLEKVELIDAGGLGALLNLREWSQAKGIEFRITNVTRLVQQVLEMTRLDAVFEISGSNAARDASFVAKTKAEREKSSAARN